MPPEDNHQVYDDEGKEPSAGSSSEDPKTLHKNPAENHEAGEHEAEPKDKIRGSEEAGDEGFYRPNADEARKNSLDSAHLALSELAGAKGESLYNKAGDDGPKVMKALKGSLKQRRKVLAGGGAAAGVGTIVLVTFFMLIPLKIEHVMSNLEQHFFATTENAAEKETSILLTGYIRRILPSYKTCGGTINKDCKVKLSGSGPVTNLYKTWSNARLENKLATDYGIEFKYDKTGKNWYLKAPGTNSGGDNIGPDGEGFESDFQRADRATMRSAVNDAMQNETRWKKVMYRYKVGRLLEEKYGIKRCITFCGTKDKLAGKLDDQKKASTLFFVQRVLGLRENEIGIALACMVNESCNPTDTKPTTAEDGTTGELAGSPENADTDGAARKADQTAAQGFEAETTDKIAQTVSDIEDKGLGRVIFESVMEKIGLSAISSHVAAAIPVVNIVTTGASIIHFANEAGPAVQKLGYMVNSSTYAQSYQMYSTYSDEIHTGHDTATEIGSFTNSLGPGNRGTSKNPQVGGTGGAESSVWYQTIIDHENPNTSTATAFSGVLPKASADTSSTSEICNNGSPLPIGDIVCPELVLGQSVGALDAAHTFLSKPGASQITYLANNISGLSSIFSSLFGFILSHIPLVNSAISSVTDLASQVLQPFFMDAINVLIPNPVSLFMSGSRLFDVIAGGADVAGNLFAQVGMGGHAINDTQYSQIVAEQENEQQQQFQSQPFFARMFDTSSSDSLVSRVALAVPFGLQADAQSGLASLINPFSAISHGFGSLLSGKVSAVTTPGPDPIGVQRNGLTQADFDELNREIAADGGDPQVWWDDNCSNNASYAYMKNNDWNKEASKSSNVNPNTGMPQYTTPNFCLAMHTTIGIDGGYDDSSNLTSDDLADANGPSGGTTGTGPTTPTPSGDYTNPFPGGWVPNRLDMGYDGTFKGQIVAPFSGTVTYAGPFTGWSGSDGVIIKADNDFGMPTKCLYFTEGVSPIASLQGKHVDVGTAIANATASPYGTYAGQSTSVGAIEWGVAADCPTGTFVNTEAVVLGAGKCPAYTKQSRSMVLNFSQWAQKSLGLPPPATTDDAGCA